MVEILKKARELYYKGVEYESLNSYGYPSERKFTVSNIITIVINNTGIWIGSHNGYIYLDGKWANIINKSNIIEVW